MEWLAHQPEEEIVVSESRSRRIDTKQKKSNAKQSSAPRINSASASASHRPVAHTRAALRLSVLAWSSRARRTHSAWLFLAFNSVLKCEDPSLRAAAWADHASCEQSVDGRRARRARALQPSEYSVGRRVRRLRLCAPTALRCAVVLERRDALCRPALLPGPAVMRGIPSSSCRGSSGGNRGTKPCLTCDLRPGQTTALSWTRPLGLQNQDRKQQMNAIDITS